MTKKRIQRKNNNNLGFRVLTSLFAITTIVILLLMFFMIIRAAFPAYQKFGFFHMYFTANFSQSGNWGIWGAMIITLFTAIFATIIATPIALRTSIFVVFRLKHGQKTVRFIINILAGVPSVVFGLFAMNIFGNVSRFFFGYNSSLTIVNGVLILVMMILPTSIALMINQLKNIDRSLIDASIALGNSKSHTIYKVVKKSIKSGIWIAIIVSLGRAIGETMALSMILTNSTPGNPFTSGLHNFLGSSFGSLGVQIARLLYSDAGKYTQSAMFAAGIALFIMVMLLVAGTSKIASNKKMENNNPFKHQQFITKDQYPLTIFYWVKVLWHYVLFPLRVIRFAVVSCLSYFAQIITTTKNYAVARVAHVFLPKYQKSANNVSYYIKVKQSWNQKFGDGMRLFWELFAMFIVVGSSMWILLNILSRGVANWSLSEWAFTHTYNDPIFGTKLKRPTEIGNTMVFTLVLVLLTLVIALPFALFSAIFLSEYARNKQSGRVIRFFIDSLNGTPSIIFGAFGLVFFRDTLKIAGGRLSLLAAALTMVLVIIPTFTRAIEQVLIKVSTAMINASYALGASKFETIRKIIIPHSTRGILSGLILSAARVIAETAPIYLLIGMLGNNSINLFDQGWTMTTRILYNQIWSPGNLLANTNASYAIAAASILLISALILITETIPWQIKHLYKPLGRTFKQSLKLVKLRKGVKHA